jgi:hypothetical protein
MISVISAFLIGVIVGGCIMILIMSLFIVDREPVKRLSRGNCDITPSTPE